jgi:hypothetical protein
LFRYFVFLFHDFFLFSAASVSSAVFCFVLAAKGQRCDAGKFFSKNTLKRSAEEDFLKKTLGLELSVSQLWDTFANRRKNSRTGCIQ